MKSYMIKSENTFTFNMFWPLFRKMYFQIFFFLLPAFPKHEFICMMNLNLYNIMNEGKTSLKVSLVIRQSVQGGGATGSLNYCCYTAWCRRRITNERLQCNPGNTGISSGKLLRRQWQHRNERWCLKVQYEQDVRPVECNDPKTQVLELYFKDAH